MAAEIRIIITGEDDASSVLHNVQRGIAGVGDEAEKRSGGVRGFLGGVAQVAGGLVVSNILGQVTSQIGNIAHGMIAGNAEFERYETQFGVLLKSSDAAKQRLGELAKFGASTPFELPELVQADKVLTAFGLHSEDTAKKFGVSGEQILTTIGDVAAGTGVNFQELSLTFGKFASGATGEAIARFQELGIATKEEMASWGLEFSKSGQLLTPAAEAFTILESHVREKFGGMMAAQSQTFEGMVSNLQDWVGQTLRVVGQPIFEVLKDKLQGLLTFLTDPGTQAAIQAFAETLAQGIGAAISFLATVIPPVVSAVQGIIAAFQEEIDSGGGILSALAYVVKTATGFDLNPIVAAIEAVIGAFQSGGEGANALGVVLRDLAGIWQALQPVITNVANAVRAVVMAVFAQIQTFLAAHGDDISATMTQTWNQIMQIVRTGIQLYNAIVPPVLQAIAGFINAHGAEIQALMSNTWNAIKAIIDAALTLIQGVLTAALQLIQGNWSGAWQTIQQMSARIVQDIIVVIQSGIGNIVTLFGGLASQVTGALQGLVDGAAAIGSGIVNGIINGVQSAAGNLLSYMRQLGIDAIEAVKHILGIASPSAVAAEQIGLPFAQGIAQGMLGGASMVATTSAGMGQLALAGAGSTVNVGGVTVNGSPGMDIERLAQEVIDTLERRIALRG